eukprot:736652-Rhodomonas_salina.4
MTRMLMLRTAGFGGRETGQQQLRQRSILLVLNTPFRMAFPEPLHRASQDEMALFSHAALLQEEATQPVWSGSYLSN